MTTQLAQLRLAEGGEQLNSPSKFSIRDFPVAEGTEFDRYLAETLNRGKLKSPSFTSSAFLSSKPKSDPKAEKCHRYVLTYYLGLGLAHCINLRLRYEKKTRNRAEKPLDVQDFLEEVQWEFPPEGDKKQRTPKHEAGHFSFHEYAPEVFRRIRKIEHIREEDYKQELTDHDDFIRFGTNSKSGSFFFTTHNGDYIVKSQTEYESNVLIKLLPAYYEHLLEQENSLLVRFLGLYLVKGPCIQRKSFFIVMKSVYSYSEKIQRSIHYVFDLKGSSVGRRTAEEERVKKDQDLRRMLEEEGFNKVKLGADKLSFLQQIESDTELLRRHNIMDYSLLLAIHDPNVDDRRTPCFNAKSMMFSSSEEIMKIKRNRGMRMSTRLGMNSEASMMQAAEEARKNNAKFAVVSARGENEKTTQYYIGIIDILQEFTWKKFAENQYKGLKSDRHQISAVPAKEYQKRFVNFVESITESTPEAEHEPSNT